MGMMKELESTSTLFGANAPFIEELYERYLADPASVDAEWRAYFDELRGGADDVAHAPVVESFRELARNRRVQGAMVDATTMHKQVLVLRLISKYRTLGMLRADLDPLQPARARLHPRPRPRHLRLHRRRHGHRVRRRLVQGGAGSACGCATSCRRCATRTRARSAPSTCTSPTPPPSASSRSASSRSARGRPTPPEQRRHILERLTAAETLERYLHTQVRRPEALLGRGRRHR